MLEENKALRMRLHSLTIFRGLLEDPVVSRLAALLHAQPSDAEACADAYCAFAAALYERGGDLSTYLLKAVLEDENLYVRRAASGASIPAELAECLQHELCFLQELSKFDGAALRGALERRRAICVLAEGSLVAGPACNAPLFARLRKEGLLLSEFPPPFHAPVYRFSARNRIVAALSEAVLVVSAGEQSGTFFTANAARALGKPVYAFPYSPGIASGVGCNALLKDYAKCTDKLVDIAAAFGINLTETGSETLSEREEKALELLGQRPMHAAELAELLGEKPQELSALLTLLEMKGRVVSLGGNRYSLVR